MKENKSELSLEDVLHLNFGIPVAIGIILFIVNAEVFVIKFLEPFFKLVLIYSYASILILFSLVLITKRKKKETKILVISYYDFFVHNAVLVLIFLIFNLSFISTNIYETNTPFDDNYLLNKSKLDIPKAYDKFYTISEKEYNSYYKKGYNYSVIVGESYFGYKFIKQKKFIKQ